MPMHDQSIGTTIQDFGDKSWSMENVRQLLGSIKTDSGSVCDHLSLKIGRSRKTGEITFDQMAGASCVPASARSTLHRSDLCAGHQACPGQRDP